MWTGRNSSDIRQGPVTESCEHGNEHSGSMKDTELLDQLNNTDFLKKNSVHNYLHRKLTLG
jgi:hypothetical protein